METSAHQYIKAGSAKLHQDAEQALDVKSVFTGNMSYPRYILLLRTHATVIDTVVHALGTNAPADLTPFYNAVLRLQFALRQDLENLPSSATVNQRPGPKATSRETCLGMLYVTLGATHGSRIILPKLIVSPSLAGIDHHHFYETSAGVPLQLWKKFIQLLNESIIGKEARGTCLTAAQDTFALFIHVHGLLKKTTNLSLDS